MKFRDRVEGFVNQFGLSTDKKESLIRAIIKYVSKASTAREFTRIGERLKIKSELQEFKSTYLDMTEYTLSCIWRAVHVYYTRNSRYWRCYRCILRNECMNHIRLNDYDHCDEYYPSKKVIAKEFNVEAYDMLYIIKYVDRDLEKALIDISTRTKVEHCKTISMETILNVLHPFIKNQVTKKRGGGVGFIYRYNNFPREDAIKDLQAKALQIALKVDAEVGKGEELKFYNTIRRGLKNHCNNEITRFKCAKRARLVEDKDTVYKKVVVSLDSEKDGLNAVTTKGEYDSGFDEVLDNIIIGRLTEQLSKKQVRFVRIILGAPDDEFYNWAKGQIGEKSYRDIPLRKLTRLAKEFLGIREEKVIQIGRKLKGIQSEERITMEVLNE